jgi:hypothetical protein
MPQRWNTLRAAAWGACIGGIVVTFGQIGQWGSARLAEHIGEVIGGACAGGLIFGVATVMRNIVVRAR